MAIFSRYINSGDTIEQNSKYTYIHRNSISWLLVFSSGPSKAGHKKWIKDWYPEASNIEVYDIRDNGHGKYSTYITFDMNKRRTKCSTTVFATDLGKNLYDLEEKFHGCKSNK